MGSFAVEEGAMTIFPWIEEHSLSLRELACYRKAIEAGIRFCQWMWRMSFEARRGTDSARLQNMFVDRVNVGSEYRKPCKCCTSA
jgi:hypothetical protein